MTFLAEWIKTPGVEALGAALAHSLWIASLAALLPAAALWAGASARKRYGAACAALLLSAAGFFVSFGLALVRGLETTAAAAPAFGGSGGLAGTPAQVASGSWISTVLDAAPWAVPLYLAGVLALSLDHLRNWWLMRCIIAAATPAPAAWTRRLDVLARDLGVRGPVRLLETPLVDTPATAGVWRPVILAPLGLLAGFSTEQMELILLHELAHVRRGDYLAHLLLRAVEILLFYHPAAMWCARVARAEREACCDELASRTAGDRLAYASALVELERFRTRELAPALGAADGDLVGRVRRLLEPPPARRPIQPAALALVVAALLAMFAPVQAQRGDGEESTFLDEVGLIAEREEREAYLKLSSDAERDQFVEQFWERRDPTPGDGANEFREEHYRRIAYADARMAEPDLRGAMTERGRIYIVHGPPDEIEAHPSGGGGATYSRPEPYVAWRYRLDDGRFETYYFVDLGRDGRYLPYTP